MNQERAREFLRRLNDLEKECGLRIDLTGSDGDIGLAIKDEKLDDVRVSCGGSPGTLMLEEDWTPPKPMPPKHIPTKIELKRRGRC